ncbi:hypothetical protein G7Y89_g14925 [Cudoniella acicularis]|uniref:C2H2-type domain-containing protein n=1 Tax=Cudoniella acicularis TaxID=354080 RepID=A0A8H4QVW6_9HELO|nr:hypothetical protein G7Y89_g14925 [Cudoniella acicularis]
MPIGQPSYPLSRLDNNWNVCSTNDNTNRYTHNLTPHPFHDFAESRDYTSTPEPEATSYPRQTNQWPKDCSLPLGCWPLFPESEEYDYGGGESQSLALSTSQAIVQKLIKYRDLDNGNTPDPQASEADVEVRALAAGALAAANNPLQTQVRLETPNIIHGAVNDLAEILCIECGTQFVNKRALNHHTRETQHAPVDNFRMPEPNKAKLVKFRCRLLRKSDSNPILARSVLVSRPRDESRGRSVRRSRHPSKAPPVPIVERYSEAPTTTS